MSDGINDGLVNDAFGVKKVKVKIRSVKPGKIRVPDNDELCANSFHDWCAIEDIPMRKREPMWDGAIKHLMSEGAIGPTMQYELTQGQIQEIIIQLSPKFTIHELVIHFGNWMVSDMGVTRFYVLRFTTGAELWLAYLMATRYALKWNGEAWVEV